MNNKLKMIGLVAGLSLGTAACATSHRDVEHSRNPSMESRRNNTAFISAENIKEAERVLKSQGYDPGAVDGRMTDETRTALRNFQGTRNVPQTGVLDRLTVSELQEVGAMFTGTLGAIKQNDKVYPDPYIPSK